MAANVLNSKVAIDASILLVRVFVQMREIVIEHADLRRRLQFLEQRLAKGFAEHTEELREIRFLIAQFEGPRLTKKRKIGL